MTRKLYLRLYFAFLGVLLAVVAVVAGINILTGRGVAMFRGGPRMGGHLARMVDMRREPLDRVVEDLHDELGVDITIFGPDGTRTTSITRTTSPAGCRECTAWCRRLCTACREAWSWRACRSRRAWCAGS